MIVIADSTPLNYLILIHQVDLLPQLFDRILIPPAVFEELQHQETPDVVRRWIAGPPSWLQVQALRSVLDPALGFLDPGEREAIALAEELQADQLLLDDADASPTAWAASPEPSSAAGPPFTLERARLRAACPRARASTARRPRR